MKRPERHAGIEVRIVLVDLRDGRRRAAAFDVIVGLAVEIHVVEKKLTHVVAHDVEHDLHAARVCVVHERAQRCGVAEVHVELMQIGLPVPVVAVDVRVGVDVLHDGRNPERRHAEVLEVIEMILDALPVAALILA